ncbi:MAG: ABC transporter substrate-binding protein [bacterium]|nr:ABC transporter substrate-binding protein [bacterium]
MSLRASVKHFGLLFVLALGGWALWPPKSVSPGAGAASPLHSGLRSPARFEIQFSPGMTYIPGTAPYGVGKPVEGLAGVVADFEKRYPDTRVTLVNIPNLREYLVIQLSSGQAPDIVNVNVENVWQDIQKGWFVALDPWLEKPNPFIPAGQPGSRQWWDQFKYQAITRRKAAPDGKAYCLSYDMVETGIYYNKSIFRKVGLQAPRDWDEFLAVQRRLREAGYIPLLMTRDNFNWAIDLTFDQLYVDLAPGIDLNENAARAGSLGAYLDWDELIALHERGFFTRRDARYLDLWRILHDWRPYMNSDLVTTDKIREFVNQNGAMIWDTNLLTYRLLADKQLGFDWGVFYPPPFTKRTSRFASGRPMCVIGGMANQYEITNTAFSDTGDPATSERLRRVIAFLQFITVPANYERIVCEIPAYMPNIVGVPAPPSLRPFEEILLRRYAIAKWTLTFDLRFTEIRTRMLDLYLSDGIDLNEFMVWMERNLDAACDSILRRKHPDMKELDRQWNLKAPARAGKEGLP